MGHSKEESSLALRVNMILRQWLMYQNSTCFKGVTDSLRIKEGDCFLTLPKFI